MYHREIVDGALFVSCGDPPKVLQPVDQALDDVTLPVCLAIEAGLTPLVGLGRDHRDDAALTQGKPDAATAEALSPTSLVGRRRGRPRPMRRIAPRLIKALTCVLS